MPKSKEKAAEQGMQTICARLRGRAKAVTREIAFANEDVPEFLARLRRFEEESARVTHQVG